MNETIQNGKEKEPISLFQGQGCAGSDPRRADACGAARNYGVHPTQIGTWKRSAIANMPWGFERGKSEHTLQSETEMEKLHSKIGQLVVERVFLASASQQLLGMRGKKW